MNLTNREKELVQHALSYMFSNLDDINECFDFCKPYEEKEIEKLIQKLSHEGVN